MSGNVEDLTPLDVTVTAKRYRPPVDDPDEVIIQIGSTRLAGWKTTSITRSCEMMPNSWSVTASTQFMQGAGLALTRPGQPCSIYIGSDLVITGWIDRRSIVTSATSHDVRLSGRGITRNLVDCSADILDGPLKGGMLNATSTIDLARKLCARFNITARLAVADEGIAIQAFQVALGETPFQIIESVARYAGYLVYEDTGGDLVLDRIGTNQMASGFTQPGNIEALDATQSVDGRYSHYIVVYYGVNSLFETGALPGQRAIVIDKTMSEYRPLIRVSPQIVPAFDVGQAMANWEWARRLGRSQAATITCNSWRDNSGPPGRLWTPNWLAPIQAPDSDISNALWIIGTVTYRKDMSGTHADLVLMPPAGFTPEPNPLNLWDAEIAGQPPRSQSPAPPTTTPSQSAPPWLPVPQQ